MGRPARVACLDTCHARGLSGSGQVGCRCHRIFMTSPQLVEATLLRWLLPSKTSYPAMANGSWSLPLISTSSKANGYVPSSVASEHFVRPAFSSSANPLPTASTPTRATTPNTTNRTAKYLFLRSVPPCFAGAYGRISVSTPASRAGPHVTSAPYSCERGGRITQMQYICVKCYKAGVRELR
jgi:hypothetical protein